MRVAEYDARSEAGAQTKCEYCRTGTMRNEAGVQTDGREWEVETYRIVALWVGPVSRFTHDLST